MCAFTLTYVCMCESVEEEKKGLTVGAQEGGGNGRGDTIPGHSAAGEQTQA